MQGVSFEMLADTGWVLGTLQAGFGGFTPEGQVPTLPVLVCLPYEVVVP